MGGGETPTPPGFYALVNGQIFPFTPNLSEGDGYWIEPEDIAQAVESANGQPFTLHLKLPFNVTELQDPRNTGICKAQTLNGTDEWILSLQVDDEINGNAVFTPYPSVEGYTYFGFQTSEF